MITASVTTKRILRKSLIVVLLVSMSVTGYMVSQMVRAVRNNETLLLCAKNNDTSCVINLVNAGADANAREILDKDKSTWSRFLALVTRRPARQGDSALLLALEHQTPDELLIRTLLSHGANPNVANEEATALSLAIDSKQLALVRLLLRYGANPNTGETVLYGERPLTLASQQGNEEMVRLLLRYGADAKYKDVQMSNESVNGNDGGALYAVQKELMFHPTDLHLKNVLELLKQVSRPR